jgi:hypothetical protein
LHSGFDRYKASGEEIRGDSVCYRGETVNTRAWAATKGKQRIGWSFVQSTEIQSLKAAIVTLSVLKLTLLFYIKKATNVKKEFILSQVLSLTGISGLIAIYRENAF